MGTHTAQSVGHLLHPLHRDCDSSRSTFQLWHGFHTSSWETNWFEYNLRSYNQNSLIKRWSIYLRSIKSSYCILCISRIFKLNKSKSRWVPGDPNIPKRAVLGKSRLKFMFWCTTAKIPNIHFAAKIPVSVRHCEKVWNQIRTKLWATAVDTLHHMCYTKTRNLIHRKQPTKQRKIVDVVTAKFKGFF